MHRIALAGIAALMLSTAATAQVSGAPVESKPEEATAPGEEQPSLRDDADRTALRGDDRATSRDQQRSEQPSAAPTPRPSTPPSPDGVTEPPEGAPTSASDAPPKN